MRIAKAAGRWSLAVTMVAVGTAAVAPAAQAQLRDDPGFSTNVLPRNDDGSTGLVPLGFDVNFFGRTFSEVYVNNNGNITFDQALATYTPFDLTTTSRVIIAPFFADVDTRGPGSVETRFGTSTLDGRPAFGVTWNGVGYYSAHDDLLNFFQLVLVDRADVAAGDFDFEFNYGSMRWETGDASGGDGGLGGACARAGYSDGDEVSFELPGSAECGAFLDGGPNSLQDLGRVTFQVRNGQVNPPNVVPEPGTVVLLGSGLLMLGGVGLRRRRRPGAPTR